MAFVACQGINQRATVWITSQGTGVAVVRKMRVISLQPLNNGEKEKSRRGSAGPTSDWLMVDQPSGLQEDSCSLFDK